MGEVYCARDTRLQRTVAVKVLPEAFALDPDRIERLQREALLLASLNHPNIATIHGLEEADGICGLVMELIEGPTLADRIAQGPIPLDEMRDVARQIADALQVAHEHGIIHRDLKPANIKVKRDGSVKLLDFGLAKLFGAQAGHTAPSNSPTLPESMPGLVLGTPAYMSPEQAMGHPANRRADVWAYGCVVFEMLTGRAPFEGRTTSEILANVLKSEPDWHLLPGDTPEAIQRLLRRCLQKDQKRRLGDVGDARLELDEVETEARVQPGASLHGRRERLAWGCRRSTACPTHLELEAPALTTAAAVIAQPAVDGGASVPAGAGSRSGNCGGSTVA